MFKSIVIAIDTSEAAKKAIEVGADLARCCGSKVTLVHASAGPGNMLFEDPSIVAEGDQELEEAEQLLKTTAEALSDLHPDTQIVDVPAGSHICNYAKSIGADLIVIGRRHHGFMGELFGRSLSRSVLEHSDISILVAK